MLLVSSVLIDSGSTENSGNYTIFMEDLEETAFASYPLQSHIWDRFVADIISVVKKDRAQLLLTHLNHQHRQINFTMGVKSSDSLTFMDVRFTRQAGG